MVVKHCPPAQRKKYDARSIVFPGISGKSMTRVSPRRPASAGTNRTNVRDSLEELSYSRIDYDYHTNSQLAMATGRADSISAPTVTSYNWDSLALIKRETQNTPMNRQ